MKGIALFSALVVAASFAAAQTQNMGGWSSGSAYNQLYKPAGEVTFSGRIVGQSNVSPESGMAAGDTILVKSPNGGVSAVDLGPAWFIKNQKTQLRVGDNVKVTGVKTFLNDRSFVMARKVIKGKHALYVREVNGFPMWVATRQYPDGNGPGYTAFNLGIQPNGHEAASSIGPVAIAQTPAPATDTTTTATSTTAANTPGQTHGVIQQVLNVQNPQTGQMEEYLVVQTPNGLVNVDVGPQWYMQQQPVTWNNGSNVAFSGTPLTNSTTVLPNNGNPIIMANGVAYGSQYLVLRDGQFSTFNAWY